MARCRRIQAAENIHRGGFARSRRPQHGDELARTDGQIDAVESDHGRFARTIDFAHIDQPDEFGAHVPLLGLAMSRIIRSPGLRSPESTSVLWPSERPIFRSRGTGILPSSTQTRPLSSPFVEGSRGGGDASFTGGVKRSAPLGTRIASLVSDTRILAVAVRPGRSSLALLSTVKRPS